MKSKRIICGIVAATLTLGVTLSGCATLVSTNNEKDVKQVIATVDISLSDNFKQEGFEEYSSAITSTEIIKRDLVAAFINVGASYVSNGSTYSEVFTSLVDSLANTAVVTQYATIYMIKEKEANDNDTTVLSQFTSFKTDVERYEYLLGGADSDDVKLAKYNLYSSINSSLDSIEEDIINAESTTAGTDSRTTPSGIDTTVDGYYPQKADGSLNYGVFTGYDKYLLDKTWEYEEVKGSTRNTRRKAYNSFISTLKSNYLISTEDKDTTDILNLSYIQEEYVSQLQQVLIDNFYDVFESKQEDIILNSVDESGEITYLKNTYEKLYNEQAESYSTTSEFESAMGSMSDSSFIIYSPETASNTEGGSGKFGYVYNILLPFSSLQSYKLDELSDYLSNNTIDDNGYYNGRKQLLANIETTDQRSAWFNGEEDYSFNAAETTLAGKYYPLNHEYRNYLFFKNNLLNTDKYESLDKYIGYYTYNGKVSENSDGTYSLVPNKLTIDGMLEEFANYIDFVLGSKSVSYSTDANYEANSTTTNYYTDSTKSEIDYSKFVYASGKVDFGGENRNTMFVKDSAQYLAMAAVNELQYAYTTDTSVLSQYVGYTVSAYSTSFIKEFEYAAQEAVKNGAGSFNVCAGDYGWHLIYVTQTFDVEGGAVYGEELKWDLESIQKEGTFQNMFYEWVKDSLLSNITTTKRSTIIEMFGGDTTITKNEDTYQDLLELDS